MNNQKWLKPEDSKLFTPWTDPVSGVTSYILTERVAANQQAFYFTSPNITEDGRYVWLYLSFPPTPGHILGVLDMKEESLRMFPESSFVAEAPFIDPKTGYAIWASRNEIFMRGPRLDDHTSLLGRIDAPGNMAGSQDYKGIRRLTTHLTRSADGKWLNIDMIAGDEWHIGAFHIETGRYEHWQTFDACYKHAQFSPTDSDLMMICQDHWQDIKTGKFNPYVNRLWLIRRGETAMPIFPNVVRGDLHAHEWWAKNGKGIWYVNYEGGTHYVPLDTMRTELVWPGGTCHSHSSTDDRYLVGDINVYQWNEKPVSVMFYNRVTGKEVTIATALPAPVTRSKYHADPHPQFVLHDEFIAYTTTVLGGLDFALVRTSDLIGATK